MILGIAIRHLQPYYAWHVSSLGAVIGRWMTTVMINCTGRLALTEAGRRLIDLEGQNPGILRYR